ncbi:hypothetical protein DTO271G3_5297 [Paecilomyces variotii]|nr:hypothetical protein DTO271G3_5297 [Paecilomyces variotii]
MRQLAACLRANPNARIQDVAYSTTARKVHHPIGFALAAATLQEAVCKLDARSSAPPARPGNQHPLPPCCVCFHRLGFPLREHGKRAVPDEPRLPQEGQPVRGHWHFPQSLPFLDIIPIDAVDSNHWMQPDAFLTHFANAIESLPDFRGV